MMRLFVIDVTINYHLLHHEHSNRSGLGIGPRMLQVSGCPAYAVIETGGHIFSQHPNDLF